MRDISISQLRESVIDSNARSIFIDAHPKKSINKIDLISIANLSNKLDPKIISNKLLSNESFKIKFPINTPATSILLFI